MYRLTVPITRQSLIGSPRTASLRLRRIVAPTGPAEDKPKPCVPDGMAYDGMSDPGVVNGRKAFT